MITEGEILDAIHRPLGAKSLDGVKRRTRAGMEDASLDSARQEPWKFSHGNWEKTCPKLQKRAESPGLSSVQIKTDCRKKASR